MEKREPFYTVAGNVNWCSHCGKSMEVSQKTKNGAPPSLISVPSWEIIYYQLMEEEKYLRSGLQMDMLAPERSSLKLYYNLFRGGPERQW